MLGYVFPMLEIGPEYGMVKGVAIALIFGPFSQFLRQTTVEGHFAIAEGQIEFASHLAQTGQHAGNVNRLSGKQGF